MDEAQVIGSLSALAHPIRLRVFRALIVTGQSGLTPKVMQEGLSVPAATLSFHLKELLIARLVTVERSSRSLIYRASYESMDDLMRYLTENCCHGEACLPAAADSICEC
jgi:DNA-binding transcriptional ArsR family regulator